MFKSLSEVSGMKTNVVLAPYTTWRIGGSAKYYLEPESEELLTEVLAYCDQNNIKVYFLGRGSNTLISDTGLDGLVICTKRSFQNMEVKDNLIIAESGVPLPTLSKKAAKLGFSGYEFLIGIPGTVGAGVVINAGLSSKDRIEISDCVTKVTVLTEKGQKLELSNEELKFGYRSSMLCIKNWFVLDATFELREKSNPELIQQKTLAHLADRRSKQPLTKPTAGSTFKQPEGGKSAGWYIEQAGLKGFRIGGAIISDKHANWIENIENATSKDITSLISYIIEKVKEVHGIVLEKEVSFLS